MTAYRIAVLALGVTFSSAILNHYLSEQEHAGLKLAIQQAKQGERFTASDGRDLCFALLSVHPETDPLLPPVCLNPGRSAP